MKMPCRRLSRRIFALLLLAGLAGMSAHAADAPYITAKDLDLLTILPPPVQNGSEADRAEQAMVIAAQRAASPERIAQAGVDAEETVFIMFSPLLGDLFDARKLPATAHLFARIGETEDAVVDPAKAIFGRIRPFMNNPDIKPLVKQSRSGAYPSGHTTRVNAMAIVLAAMLPEKRAAIWVRAEDYAQSRIIGGMHYPNDLDGGKRAGTAIAVALLARPDVQADIAAARTELRAALGMTP
jgi:acid phosphatase (class A)